MISFLRKAHQQHTILGEIYALLEWDQETNLLENGMPARTNQLAFLAKSMHKELTNATYTKKLSKHIDLVTGEVCNADYTFIEKAALREARREWLLATKLPASFVAEFTETTGHAMQVWNKAKTNRDFSLFAKPLNQVITLSRKKADFLGYTDHPYDALLDLYEPSFLSNALQALFKDLKSSLIPLIQTCVKAPRIALSSSLPFCLEKQKQVGQELLHLLTLSTTRLDISSHPFCTRIHPDDLRMTTRLDPLNLWSNFFSVLHEGGHALYHRNLPKQFYGTPLCDATSYAVDESQSRFFETILGKSLPFIDYITPKLHELFPKQLSSYSSEDLYRLINQVEATPIRIEADEVTYNLHIILRFELEQALLEGSLSVEEIPDAWNQKMKDYLGIIPKHDGEGCLQDIHWAMGGMGYFPSYTLGNLIAAQFFQTMQGELPDWHQQIRTGQFQPIIQWLSNNIHSHGKIYSTEDLIRKVTHNPLNSSNYMHYLETKFHKLS